MFSVESFVYACDNQCRYALALVEDLTDAQMVLRPGGNMNHPAWILGHVSLYHPATVAMLAGKPFDDPKNDVLFGFAGKGPQDDVAAYGGKEKIVSRFRDGHEQVVQALLSAKPSDFERKPSLERWAASYPTVEFMLPDLLVFHESIHIGQISIWRRAAGLKGVPFPDRTPRAGLIK
jgi:DinB family protein